MKMLTVSQSLNSQYNLNMSTSYLKLVLKLNVIVLQKE